MSNAATRKVNAKFKTYKGGTPNTGWPYQDSIFTKYQYVGIPLKKEKQVYKPYYSSSEKSYIVSDCLRECGHGSCSVDLDISFIK